jgi:DNA-binding XRE family transcriptional regulator
MAAGPLTIDDVTTKVACPHCGTGSKVEVIQSALLVALRKSRGITQAEMANRLGVSQTYLGQCENERNGKRAVSFTRELAERFIATAYT